MLPLIRICIWLDFLVFPSHSTFHPFHWVDSPWRKNEINKKFTGENAVLNEHPLCTEARKEGMFLTTEVFYSNLLSGARELLRILCNTLEGRCKLAARCERFLICQIFPFMIFFLSFSLIRPPPLHTFPNGPSVTGLAFILAEHPPTLHPIVYWGGSFCDQPKQS